VVVVAPLGMIATGMQWDPYMPPSGLSGSDAPWLGKLLVLGNPPSFEKNKKARYFFDGSVSHGNVGLSGLFALMVNIKTIIITACFCCMAAALLPA